MKNIEKYFLAIIPSEPVFTQAEEIKGKLKEHFGIKYALKSPAHVTLKMPFSYDSQRMDKLRATLSNFYSGFSAFELEVSGLGHFGNRVIYLKIKQSESLQELQSALRIHCRRELHLVEELSDRNFTPHMTVAFKDIKPARYEEIWNYAQSLSFQSKFSVNRIALLRKVQGHWVIQEYFDLRSN